MSVSDEFKKKILPCLPPFKLIQVWGEERIQEQFEGPKQNKHVYEKLSRTLATYRIEKSGEQCRTKVIKLQQEYKKIKDKHSQTDEERSQWKFYDKLDEILGTRPATCPPIVLETFDNNQTNNSNETDIEDLENSMNQSSLLDDSASPNTSVSEQSSSDDNGDQKRTVKSKNKRDAKEKLWKT